MSRVRGKELCTLSCTGEKDHLLGVAHTGVGGQVGSNKSPNNGMLVTHFILTHNTQRHIYMDVPLQPPFTVISAIPDSVALD